MSSTVLCARDGIRACPVATHVCLLHHICGNIGQHVMQAVGLTGLNAVKLMPSTLARLVASLSSPELGVQHFAALAVAALACHSLKDRNQPFMVGGQLRLQHDLIQCFHCSVNQNVQKGLQCACYYLGRVVKSSVYVSNRSSSNKKAPAIVAMFTAAPQCCIFFISFSPSEFLPCLQGSNCMAAASQQLQVITSTHCA